MTIDLSTLIKTRRNEIGITQEELADRCGCHRTTIIKAEQDATAMRYDLLQAILYELYLKMEIVKLEEVDDGK